MFQNTSVAENYMVLKYCNSNGVEIHIDQRHTCNENKLRLTRAAEHMLVFYSAVSFIKLMF